MLRFSFSMITVFLGMALVAAVAIAQNTEPEQPTEWDFLRTEIQTRLGKARFDKIPDTIEFEHPRFYRDFKMGRFNTWLASEPDAPNFRFRSVPEQQLPQSQHRSDILPAEKTNKRIVSANTPVQADTSTNFPPQPIRRLPGFFERSGIMDATVLPEENPVRSSGGSRWFRDFNRNDPSGVQGLSSRSQQNSGGNDYFNGNAVVVGGELLQNKPTPQSPVSATEANFRTNPVDRQSATRNQAETLRRFEQKLEGMLLTHPSIHFLSPVQISFQNGVVSVRGVVSDKEHKIAAGNFLLTNPEVKQVNNLISVVPTDPTQITVPVEPK
ncbi:MAG: hypothetical protein LBK82_06240 [Planctomycetaceae bacterium]|jgi:hypothetical protein|nr:hypothetical protein [Planctomycetaceae bacterium]